MSPTERHRRAGAIHVVCTALLSLLVSPWGVWGPGACLDKTAPTSLLRTPSCCAPAYATALPAARWHPLSQAWHFGHYVSFFMDKACNAPAASGLRNALHEPFHAQTPTHVSSIALPCHSLFLSPHRPTSADLCTLHLLLSACSTRRCSCGWSWPRAGRGLGPTAGQSACSAWCRIPPGQPQQQP